MLTYVYMCTQVDYDDRVYLTSYVVDSEVFCSKEVPLAYKQAYVRFHWTNEQIVCLSHIQQPCKEDCKQSVTQ